MKGFSTRIRKMLCLLLLLSGAVSAFAQSTVGTDFWMAFMPNFRYAEQYPSRSLSIKVSAERACSGTVTNPRTNWSADFNVNAGQVTTVDIPYEQAYDEQASDTILDIGLHVVATDSISLFAFNYRETSMDASCIMPTHTLGCDYVVQCYAPNTINNDAMRSEFLVMALEDNTTVEIQLTADTKGGHHAGNLFYIVLDAGQCYQVQSVTSGEQQDGNLSGTQVRSLDGKKIAVFAGDRGTYIPDPDPFSGTADIVFEQMTPTNTWGKRFIVTSTERRYYDRVRVTAANDNCQVSLDGVLQATLGAFETYEFEMHPDVSALLLETSEPTEVFLYHTGGLYHQSDPLTGDPSMVRISPLEQTTDYVTFPVFIGTCQFFFVNIVTETELVQYMVMDGQNIASRFSEVPSIPEYSFARIQISSERHTLSNPMGGFIGRVYGMGRGVSYAYSLGVHSHSLVSQIIVNDETAVSHLSGFDVCLNDESEFDLQTNFVCSLANWDFGDGTTATGLPVTYTFIEEGDYTVSCEVYKDNQGQNVLVSILETTLHVHPTYTTEVYLTACNSYDTIGVTYTESGIYEFQNESVFGCDSIVNLHLTVNQSDTTFLNIETCDEYTWFGQTYSQAGVYEHLLQNENGCDSLLLLNLVMGESFIATESIETCNSYTWRGQNYTTGGVYEDYVVNPEGCDSTFILNLALAYDKLIDTTITACNEFVWNGQTYTESGVYEYQGQSVQGCDSIVQLNLTIGQGHQGSLLGLTQVSAASDIVSGIYEYCVPDSSSIAPNTLNWSCTNPDWLLSPSNNGYRCQLLVTNIGHGTLTAQTEHDCDTVYSIDINATWFDVSENLMDKVMVYPNPAQQQVTIEASQITRIRLMNSLGQLVGDWQYDDVDTTTLEVEGFSQGVYLMEICTKQGRAVRRLMLIGNQ